MGQASPGPQGTPKTELARILVVIVGAAIIWGAAYLQATTKAVIYTVILTATPIIFALGQWLFPLPPSNFASLKQVLSTRIKSSWPLVLFTALILAVTSCVTWMVVTGTPLINILLTAILIALSALCLLAVAVMSIIDLVKKKASGKGTKLSINWILRKLSARQMLYMLAFLVLLVLTISTSLFYTLRLSSFSSIAVYPSKAAPHITPSSTSATPVSTGTTPFVAATKQIVPDTTIIYLISPKITQKTPLPIPCSANCVSRLDVVLERVVFENSNNDLLFTFQISNKEANVCNLAVKVLQLSGEHKTPYDGQGFGVSHLDAGQILTTSANFPLIPSPRFPYVFHLALSCQTNMTMGYEEQTLIFDSSYVSQPRPNLPVAAPVIALINSIMAFVSSPLGMSLSLIVFIFISASTFIWWLGQPRPFGVLTSITVVTMRGRRWEEEEEETSSIILGAKRSLARKLLSRSTVSSKELVELARKEHLDLKGGRFDLVFKRGRQVDIRVSKHFPPIRLRRHGERDIHVSYNQTVPLLDGDIISIDGDDIAVFQISKPADI